MESACGRQLKIGRYGRNDSDDVASAMPEEGARSSAPESCPKRYQAPDSQYFAGNIDNTPHDLESRAQ